MDAVVNSEKALSETGPLYLNDRAKRIHHWTFLFCHWVDHRK